MLPKQIIDTLEQVINVVNMQDAEIKKLQEEVEELKKAVAKPTNSRRTTKNT